MRSNPTLFASFAVLLCACEPTDPGATASTPAATATMAPSAPITAPVVLTPATVDAAAFSPEVATTEDRAPAVLRAQVLLDRAHFSPGVIDGKMGENVRQAIAAFEEANALPVDGQLDEAVFQKLTAIDARPVLTTYVIAAEDTKGPFIERVPEDLDEQSKLKAMSYTGPAELLAEKFHMTEDLLKTLNPGVDFSAVGTTITVADQGQDALPAAVARIEVDKAEKAVKAFDAQGKLLAFYPATIGSDELASPDGTVTVRSVSRNPNYNWDPAKMTKKGPTRKLTVAPGPNNPVGAVWIALSKPTYGIHGAPDPQLIGKRSSSGCVRLTNWDARELADAVKAGIEVAFVGGTTAAV